MSEESSNDPIRPTKRQKELLDYIEQFIAEHGYSPSYREIMAAQNYTSVATVATHINSLILRGHLRKRDNAARSLEITKVTLTDKKLVPKQVNETEEKWLIEKVEVHFKEVEGMPFITEANLNNLYVLIGAMKVLQLEGAAQAFIARLSSLKSRLAKGDSYVT